MNVNPKLLNNVIEDVKNKFLGYAHACGVSVDTINFDAYLRCHYQFEVNHITADSGWVKMCADAEKEYILEVRNSIILQKDNYNSKTQLVRYYGLRYPIAQLVRSIIEL